ncbi:MAG: xanthine dehydrogenase family protein [Rhodospirillaceae bacterium]|jgi:aerobic carbon-monoxide dehydrogenase large subunit|nr:xanthine dehydrogenase family protein [Rhodospirillaceae bacterium]MBT5455838.1 xanthine dehydrogenase family protein [Rhodospirillaceae bacterium]
MIPFAPGQPVLRVEDRRHLTGGGAFLDDLAVPEVTFAAMVRSPHAHARLAGIRIDDAVSMPGVLAILTGADYEADGLGRIPCLDECWRRDGSPVWVPPRPALTADCVRYVGEIAAMVIAETAVQAQEAADCVEILYEPLAAVAGIQQAIGPRATTMWDDCPDNELFFDHQGDEGAVDRAFGTAVHIVHQRLVHHRLSANTLEPRGYVGSFEGETGRYLLRGGGQSPHGLRDQLATYIFDIPSDRIRVITGDMGGSFGMRGPLYPEQALVLWAARRVGRPVKWVASRSEGFVSDDHGRDLISEASLALDQDGKFLALRVSANANVGAYLAVKGPRAPLNTLALLSGVYEIPALHVSISGVCSNTNPTSPYRGAGGPEAATILERLIDKAARKIQMDPVTLRQKNFVGADSFPHDTGIGLIYDCGDFPLVMKTAMDLADCAGFAARRDQSRGRGRLRGLGICNAIEQTARPSPESVRITLDPGDIAHIAVGTASQGQGHETIYRQIICPALGLDPDAMRIRGGDSDAVVSGAGTFNSRSAVAGGSAAVLAAEKIIEAGKPTAASLLEAAIADIEFDRGRYVIAGTDRSVTLDAVVTEASGLSAEAMFIPDSPTFPNGTHICEIEIDPETGRVALQRYTTVDDVGNVLNPLLLEGQIQGGVVQGMGQALLEAIRFDPETGQTVTGSFMDYAMPRADDVCAIETQSCPVPTALNPLGVKGAGEAGTVGAVPAVMCAVADALAALGADDLDMPATPETIWRALSQRMENLAE